MTDASAFTDIFDASAFDINTFVDNGFKFVLIVADEICFNVEDLDANDVIGGSMALCLNVSNSIDTIAIVQGEDATYEGTALDRTGAPIDLTDVQGYFTVKKRWTDLLPFILKKTLNVGGSDTQFVILDQIATKGKLRFFVDAVDTAVLTLAQVDDANNYVYDIWLIFPDGRKRVAKRMRRFEVIGAVTKIP